jgi:hypothetical protein
MALAIVPLLVVLLAAPLDAEAQLGKIYWIGFLRYLGCLDRLGTTNLLQGLRELGYVEGHNVII